MANYSPILATGGGLLFNGSMDRYVRALDADNGQVLWQTRLAVASRRRRRSPFRSAAANISRSPQAAGAVAGLQVGLTPEADTTPGSNAMYVFALPQ